MVEARDASGNLRLTGGDPIVVYAKGPGVAEVTGNVTDVGDGTYVVQYYPIVAGMYTLTVAVGSAGAHRGEGYAAFSDSLLGYQALGSPFELPRGPSK